MKQGEKQGCPIPNTLAEMKDRYRPLILFVPSLQDPRAVRQLGMLNRDELQERDVVLMLATETGYESPGTTPGMASDLGNLPLASAGVVESHHLRQKFKIGSGVFAVILVGKDGGEKLRKERPVTAAELNRKIDAMPMRQQEMSRQLPRRGTIRTSVP